MKIRVGYELIYDCPQPTPMIVAISHTFGPNTLTSFKVWTDALSDVSD